jgi:hypothetical protein
MKQARNDRLMSIEHKLWKLAKDLELRVKMKIKKDSWFNNVPGLLLIILNYLIYKDREVQVLKNNYQTGTHYLIRCKQNRTVIVLYRPNNWRLMKHRPKI